MLSHLVYQTSKPFVIEVRGDATKAQLKVFKEHMVEFLQARPKDYRDDFEVEIKGGFTFFSVWHMLIHT